MLKPDQGPGHGGMLANQVPEAAITALRGLTCCGCDKCLAKAIAAALNAWPGMDTIMLPRMVKPGHFVPQDYIRLPLMEKPDDKAW